MPSNRGNFPDYPDVGRHNLENFDECLELLNPSDFISSVPLRLSQAQTPAHKLLCKRHNRRPISGPVAIIYIPAWLHRIVSEL